MPPIPIIAAKAIIFLGVIYLFLIKYDPAKFEKIATIVMVGKSECTSFFLLAGKYDKTNDDKWPTMKCEPMKSIHITPDIRTR